MASGLSGRSRRRKQSMISAGAVISALLMGVPAATAADTAPGSGRRAGRQGDEGAARRPHRRSVRRRSPCAERQRVRPGQPERRR